MSSRTRWRVILLLCISAIVSGFVYSLRAISAQALPLLLVVPFVILAGIAWRQLRRPG